MHEKIKEIADKASEQFRKIIGEDAEPGPFYYNKFAEIYGKLIIEECIKLGEEKSAEIFKKSKNPGDVFEYGSHGAADVVDSIKEHFGLE